MGDRGLAIFSGIAEGIEKAATNIYNINLMKYKIGQEKEAFTLDKKVKEAQLKQLEFEHGPEAVAHLRKKMDLESKQYKLSGELFDLAIGEATKENQTKLSEMKTRLETLGIKEIAGVKFAGEDEDLNKKLYGDYLTNYQMMTAYMKPDKRPAKMSYQEFAEQFKTPLGGAAPSPAPTSKYKAGDTRVINGVTYKRNETGQWLTQ